jgi:hypothetical protein
VERKEYLHRLLMGLEEGIARERYQLPHYKPDDLEGRYAAKFLKAMEEQLEATRAELKTLEAAEKQSPPPPGAV